MDRILNLLLTQDACGGTAMKCVAKTDGTLIVRVKNQDAHRLVKTGKWLYAKKSEWRAGGRKRA